MPGLKSLQEPGPDAMDDQPNREDTLTKTLESAPCSLLDHVRSRNSSSVLPAWLLKLQSEAAERFLALGIPDTKHEEYKYTPLRGLEEKRFSSATFSTCAELQLQNAALFGLDAWRMVFVNGQLSAGLSELSGLPASVGVMTLRESQSRGQAEVLEAHLGRVASLEGKLGSTNDTRFVDLNTAMLHDGAFIFVPAGVELEKPIHLIFVQSADESAIAVFPRVFVMLEAGAGAEVIESYVGFECDYLSVPVTEIWLETDARLEHCRVQEESPRANHLGSLAVHQEKGSILTSNVASFGSSLAKVDLTVWLNGEHTETLLNGVYIASGEQILDHHTRIDHAFPNCNSFEVYKGILRDKATGVFNGKIFVYKDAQKTDAKQTNQALLLSPKATMNTKPQLEIFADDVKCTHGATVGQLREDALFYLRARGIPLQQARALLVYAFASQVFEKISIEGLRKILETRLLGLLTLKHEGDRENA